MNPDVQKIKNRIDEAAKIYVSKPDRVSKVRRVKHFTAGARMEAQRAWILLEALKYNICPYCNGNGTHMCPDVAEPIVVPCSFKGCSVRTIARYMGEL